MWDALVRGDSSADEALLSADFLGVYPSGFAGRADHAGQLTNGPTVVSYAILDARAMALSADHALLSYRAEYQRPGRSDTESMYVSSMWSRRGEGWVNVFSQDTPADPDIEIP